MSIFSSIYSFRQGEQLPGKKKTNKQTNKQTIGVYIRPIGQEKANEQKAANKAYCIFRNGKNYLLWFITDITEFYFGNYGAFIREFVYSEKA